MFCHICGAQMKEGSVFCHKCGTKVAYTGAARQTSIVSNTDAFLDTVQMIISIDKVIGRGYSHVTFSVFVDGILAGELANGQTAIYKISSGQHLIKVGGLVIGIDVPKENASIELDFHWGKNTKPEIVCHQSQWISKPCEMEKISVKAVLLKSLEGRLNKAGFACILTGAVGVIAGFIFMPTSYSGGVVSAERHMADLAQVDIALPFFIGGLSLWVIGALIMIISSRKKK